MRRTVCAVLAVAATALSAADAGAVDPSLRPVPIGRGPGYQPATGRAPDAFRAIPAPLRSSTRAHLELFANGLVVVVPAGIGLSDWRTTLYGFVTDALWHGEAWTLQAGGVLQLTGRRVTLGAVFAVWGRRLGPRRMLGFRGRVRAFVNGVERPGDPATIVLRDRDEVVLEVGGYVPPHRSFVFPP